MKREVRTDASFGDSLIASLEEGIAALRLNHLRTTRLPQPPNARCFSAAQVREIRERLQMPQSLFAEWLNVSAKTVEAWEQGARTPGGAASRLLQLVDEPSLLERMAPGVQSGPVVGPPSNTPKSVRSLPRRQPMAVRERVAEYEVRDTSDDTD